MSATVLLVPGVLSLISSGVMFYIATAPRLPRDERIAAAGCGAALVGMGILLVVFGFVL